MRFDVCTLIDINHVRDDKTQNKLVDKHANYRDCILILQCKRLNVFGEVIDDGHMYRSPRCVREMKPTMSMVTRSNGVYL